MHSRAGAQTPFSSINYGMDTSAEGRMVIKNILLATEAGLGSGETPIFPVQIFRVKEGVNYNRVIQIMICLSWLCAAQLSVYSPTLASLMLPITCSITKALLKRKFLIWAVVLV